MIISAFGVEHGDFISKADEPKYSSGRRNLATIYGPTHSIYAAKKGKRARSYGRSLGYQTAGAGAGGALGAGIAAAATRGKSGGAMMGGGIAGALGGAYTGNNRAFHANNKRGYYKREE